MCRCRFLWPSHLSHAPQSLQTDHWHGTGSGPSQGATLQASKVCKAPLQLVPPFSPCTWIERLRSTWPPPHGALHSPYFAQAPNAQSTTCLSFTTQSAGTLLSGVGLHGEVCFKSPTHDFPLPWPAVL